tara:strand:- start:2751 stop:2993 length:243 start_codon:yes stop_codon:yes gene_type:complete
MAIFCRLTRASLRALSLVNPIEVEDAKHLADRLDFELLPSTSIVLGGGEASRHRGIFEEMNLKVLDDLTLLEGRLLQLST